jgi:hypothetical protein
MRTAQHLSVEQVEHLAVTEKVGTAGDDLSCIVSRHCLSYEPVVSCHLRHLVLRDAAVTALATW